MSENPQFSLKISNYKCFGPEPQGLEKLLPINLIIGRNNSGKSTVIDLLKFFIEKEIPNNPALAHKGTKPEIIATSTLIERELKSAFPDGKSGGGIPGSSWWEYGRQWIDKPIKFKLIEKKKLFVSVEPDFEHLKHDRQALLEHLVNGHQTPLNGKVFRRLLADRDLQPEPEHSDMAIAPNGRGCTNLMQAILNHAKHQRELVGETLLSELNKIFYPDALFTNIYARRQENNNWEIFLAQKNSGAVALSESGSGLKTIILVLCFLYILPHVEKTAIKDYVFAFEELENNLHPAAQRRLLSYLREFSLQTGAIFLLTTHSTVAIDMFSKDKSAQILHVLKDEENTLVRTAKTYIEHKGILDDLDIRASDILQANGIIWVEGPSDRIYLNRWIQLWSDGKVVEGLHYQIVFYGGKLLSHLTGLPQDESTKDAIAIFGLNRNSALLIDSDKSSASDPLNSTKNRLISEFETSNGLVWVTAGREIENYISSDVLAEYMGAPPPARIDQYQRFPDLLDALKPGENQGLRFNRQKTVFAEKISEKFTKQNCLAMLDLNLRLTSLCDLIKKWNKFPDS